MKRIYNLKSIALVVFIATAFVGCSSDDDDEELGNWIDRSIFDGTPRSGSSAFTIGNIGYMGVGYDGDDYLNDFWAYDMDGNYWSQKADFPGVARSAAVGFTINEKGYIGTGYDGVDELGDFYQYNPSTNTWTAIADFPGTHRRSATAFSVDGYGFVGTGFDGDNDRKDFWKYDPTADTWTELEGYGGTKKRAATAFVLDGIAYLGTGVSNGVYLDDFWSFDPSTNQWTKLLDLDEEDSYNIVRSNAVSFTMNGYGYVVSGQQSGAVASAWQYNPIDDTWEEMTSFEGSSRQDAIAFSNGVRSFVGLGRTGSLYLDDLDEFFPDMEYDDED
ncbi:Kelch repeat-containing protein [Joostella sp. CR20]|uniref:Kelch repeat-containing protein n=1 Tax=Joostella sp. CR20 TaxID=2804312 RepID=UPI00313EFD11